MFHGFKVQLAPFGSLGFPVFSQLVKLIITVKATFNLQFLANHHSKNIGIKTVRKSLSSRSINFLPRNTSMDYPKFTFQFIECRIRDHL